MSSWGVSRRSARLAEHITEEGGVCSSWQEGRGLPAAWARPGPGAEQTKDQENEDQDQLID